MGNAPLLHNLFCRIHLGFKFRVVRGDPEAVRRLGDKNGVAASDLELGKRILRQNKPKGIADRGDLELHGSSPRPP